MRPVVLDKAGSVTRTCELGDAWFVTCVVAIFFLRTFVTRI